ncbi:hypothetical protein PTTW11_09749 [Pyrenophora teres f. teres]|uniref:Uncharacterized protein n=1 Tax=Pyrenophora teres f. teres TaxID=97479 RepID=A0A6S6WDY7_9PLEO|nr:hypothetical protein PTTW11_09749 [Pyrenophora teres f. teres]
MKTPALFITTLLVGMITPVALAVDGCLIWTPSCVSQACPDNTRLCSSNRGICKQGGCQDGKCQTNPDGTRTCWVQCSCD